MAVPTRTHFPRTSGARSWVDTSYRVYEPNQGNIIYAHSSGAGGTTGGRSPEDAVTTADAAVDLAVASNNDLVLVLAGHTEALIAAGTLTVDKAGVHVIGGGVGRERPVFTYTTAVGASCDVTAADCMLKNLVFSAIGFDAVTAAINISAADCWVHDCELELADGTNQAVLGILTTASANRLWINKCHIHGTPDAGTAAGIRIVGGNEIRITDNFIWGNYTTSLGGIDNVTTAMLRAIIKGNAIGNLTAASTVAINAVATSTGTIARNDLCILMGTAPIVAAGMYWVGGNYYANAVATAGTLI